MQSRCVLQVFLVLSSLVVSKANDVMGFAASCLKSNPAGFGRTRISFLRVDASGVRSLYLSLWSQDLKLLACEVHSSPLLTHSYGAVCQSSGEQAAHIPHSLDLSALWAPDAPCALLRSPGTSELSGSLRTDRTEGKTRRKRAWVFPGTLWCGTGSKAAGYEDLGMFESADRCCREHDHCMHIIPAFSVNYGVFNSKFYTVSHCDCDQRFRECLLGVNDTISSMVGYSFFNILQVPCFELKQQRRCTKMYWWGMCKAANRAPYAIFKNAIPFNSTEGSNKTGLHGTESPGMSPRTESPKREHRCGSRDPASGDAFNHRRTKGNGCKRHRKPYPAAHTQTPSVSRAHNSTLPSQSSVLRSNKSSTSVSKKTRGEKKKNTGKNPTTHLQAAAPSQTPTPHTHPPTGTTGTTKTTQSHTQSHCCGPRMPVRGDTFQPHCNNCLEHKTTSPTPLTTASGFPTKVATVKTRSLRQTTETLKQDFWSTVTTAASTLQTRASVPEDSHLFWNITGQEPMSGAPVPDAHAERSLKLNIALHNLTDDIILCGSLKHLDGCKYKIPALETKYDLQNMESKPSYHCDCTSRLAVQIESLKRPSVLPRLLMDFVSQYCFKLPKEKKCEGRKSCSAGFSKASDLLEALKKIEEKDTAGVHNSGNERKRGIPVRLYKRCLRLERKADKMAQLTRL